MGFEATLSQSQEGWLTSRLWKSTRKKWKNDFFVEGPFHCNIWYFLINPGSFYLSPLVSGFLAR